ncbi:type II toxin-antitoxin system PemK/MazF family toxin [Catenibacterium mitsuokai]|uniref:type II toxin-antitoxin system PemK/MazF family toxin n=1 Tax=Catenibacterium mitsuokai TaxID=100886 RepID=UPI0022E512EC|nr:type II toxin-antitoxin system PemK/MazF family toxin [Catenibacterium mitsuokai]
MNYSLNTREVKRGDIFYITYSKNFNDSYSYDTTGRPGVIVSDNHLNRGSEYVEVVYLTTKIKRDMPTHVDVFCKTPSTALCETIHTVEKDRIGTYVRTVSDEEMEGIERGLRRSLGMNVPVVSVNDVEPNNDMGLASMQKEIQLTAERDMFKKLYEDLLSKVVGK